MDAFDDFESDSKLKNLVDARLFINGLFRNRVLYTHIALEMGISTRAFSARAHNKLADYERGAISDIELNNYIESLKSYAAKLQAN